MNNRFMKPAIVVIGASGFIGSALFSQASENGWTVMGTHRRKTLKPMDDWGYLDLSHDGCTLNLPSRFIECKEKIAVFCSAISQIDECARHQKISKKVNVDNTQQVMLKLAEKGFKIVFISSDYVFDGEKGNYLETDLQQPVNEYGRQKKNMESFVISHFSDGLVIRISKICAAVDHPKNLFSDWYGNIMQGCDIYCIKNNIFSPTSRDDLVQAIFLSIKQKLDGIYNIAGSSMRRSDLCEQFIRFSRCVKKIKVREKDLADFCFFEKRPLNSSLNNNKFIQKTGFQYTPIEKTIQAFFKGLANPRQL